ncbi:MAG: hypothetical protein K8S27_16705 [Candidatus Omnitrophica bacterium]|nr:hypothetical protein [Candidatus Omnitrophota bacterium]
MTLISILIFCSYFPLYYWKVITRPQLKKYYRFNIYCVNSLGGVATVIFLISNFTMQTKVLAVIWKASLYLSYRLRNIYPPFLSSLIFIFQVICIYFIQQYIVEIEFHYIILLFVFNFLISSFFFNHGLKKSTTKAKESDQAQTLY